MSKTKSAGTTKLGRDSKPKHLGVKAFAGQIVKPGMVIVKQRGTKFIAGKNVARGSDDTLYALKSGVVKFVTKRKKRFDRLTKKVKVVNVESQQ